MSKCGFNIDKDCIETKCHKCKLNPMYQQGTADAEKDDLIKACINQLKESDADEVKVSADTKDGYRITVIVELKEQKNE